MSPTHLAPVNTDLGGHTACSAASSSFASAASWSAGPPADSSAGHRLGNRPPEQPIARSSLADAYTSFLIRNGSTLASVESGLRSATYLLPGRFDGAEIASEGVFSLLALVHSLHSSLLQTHLSRLPPSLRPSLPPPTLQERYTRSWAAQSAVYRVVAGLLEGVGGVALLGEMVALKGWSKASTAETRAANRERRWRWLVGVEGTKAVLRLILILLTARPVLTPPVGSASLDPTLFDPHAPVQGSSPAASTPGSACPAPPPPSSPSRGDPIRQILLPKTLLAGSLTPARELVRPLTLRQTIGEVLHSVRGLIYVLLLRSKSSSLPVVVSLLVAIISRALLRGQRLFGRGAGKGKEREGSPVVVGPLERDEFAKRDKALAGLLFRGVVWDGLTKPTLEAIARQTARIPLVGLVGGLLGDYVPLIDEFYFYTAS